MNCLKISSVELSREEIFSSIDRAGKFIMSHDSLVVVKTLPSTKYMESVVEHLGFTQYKDKNFIGTTDTIYFTPDYSLKMFSIKLPKEYPLNLLGSILHPESHQVRGDVVLVKFNNDGQIGLLNKEDVIRLLISRREHKGIHISKSGRRQVIMNNMWVIQGHENQPLGYKKIVKVANYFLLLISNEADITLSDDSEKFVFNVLDRNCKTIIDFTELELDLLIEKEQSTFDVVDDEKYLSPYLQLKSV